MLKSLLIKNYALIDDVNIRFNTGFTTITGETGGGKSILLGALSLLLGKRADHRIIRNDASKCIVEGQFDLSKIQLSEFFVKNDLDFEIYTLVRREVTPAGRSRAFINDTPVNLDVLKEFSENLIDIHSQHQTLEIGKSVFQMNVLDDFTGKPDLLNAYRKYYSKLVDLSKKLEKLSEENEQSKRDEDYFRFQYNELKTAELVEGEDEHLATREKLLAHAEEVIQGMSIVQQLISNEEGSVLEKIAEIHNWFSKLEIYHPGLAELSKRIESARIELEDISNEISSMELLTDFNPEELTKISDRLNEIYKLQQKHHVSSVSALLTLQADYENKLNNLDLTDEHLNQLKKKLDETTEHAKKYAFQIHELRKNESLKLAKAIKSVLIKLGMKDATFEVRVEQLDKLNQSGTDRVSFLFNANAGGHLSEISKVASGGELSRLMLAIKSQITREQFLPTVVFDEIDSGVSGEIAGKVGNIIREMSKHHQIIAITHLPQIAAKADQHLKVFKLVERGEAKTHIEILNESERIEEIAKLLSDEHVSEAAMNTARELLKV